MAGAQQVVGGWVLQELVGAGAHGRVWRAVRPGAGLPRAVKLVPIADEYEFATWREEVFRLDSLAAPNVVRFYDAGMVDDGGPYSDHAWIATELCVRSLADELRRRAPVRLLEPECDLLVDSMLAALAVAKQHRVVHRDVKPGNILQGGDGMWKLADFGIARLLPSGFSHAGSRVIGTSGYLSREALAGRQDYSADCYALGVTVHKALRGRLLHERPPGITDYEYALLIDTTAPRLAADLPIRWRNTVRALIGAEGSADPEMIGEWFRTTRGQHPISGTADTTRDDTTWDYDRTRDAENGRLQPGPPRKQSYDDATRTMPWSNAPTHPMPPALTCGHEVSPRRKRLGPVIATSIGVVTILVIFLLIHLVG